MTRAPRVTLVAALARDSRVIGADGDLPWRLPADLRRFKATTMGHPIVMGRKTWESIGRPLPGRRNIVLSRRAEFTAEGAEVVSSLDAALARAADADEVFVIGGEAVYEAALPRADRLLLTWVEGRFEGDAFFPAFDPDEWVERSREAVPADDRNAHATEVVVLERRSGEAR